MGKIQGSSLSKQSGELAAVLMAPGTGPRRDPTARGGPQAVPPPAPGLALPLLLPPEESGQGLGSQHPRWGGAWGGAGRLSPCPAGNGSKANALSHGEMVSLDEGSFPALELNNRRLSVKNSFCRKNGIYTR